MGMDSSGNISLRRPYRRWLAGQSTLHATNLGQVSKLFYSYTLDMNLQACSRNSVVVMSDVMSIDRR